MEDIATKNPGDSYTSPEFNTSNDELKNFIENADITLSGGDSAQLTKSTSNYVATADFFTDSGAADAYVLSVISPKLAPTGLQDGLRVRFLPANTNTGASTVNVVGLGVKSIKKYGRTVDLVAGDIVQAQNVEIAYSVSDDSFELISIESASVSESVPLFMSFSGMNLSNNGGSPNTHIDMATGTFKDKNSSLAASFSSTFTKSLSAVWAAGTGNGGRASAVALTADTWYHVFPIAKTDGTVDFGFDTNINAVNLLSDATGYTIFRRRGSILTDGGSNILAFKNLGSEFIWAAIFGQSLTLTTSFVAKTIRSPLDVFTEASIYFEISSPGTSDDSIIVKSTFQTSGANIGFAADFGGGTAVLARSFSQLIVDESSQIDVARGSAIAAGTYSLRVSKWREIDL